MRLSNVESKWSSANVQHRLDGSDVLDRFTNMCSFALALRTFTHGKKLDEKRCDEEGAHLGMSFILPLGKRACGDANNRCTDLPNIRAFAMI